METTDGRYVKILEIEPINFVLRSSEEQYNILSSFASWLKISPMKLQFKSITRKADSDKHIAMIRKELSMEDNAQCRAMGEDYIRLIKDVGSREALTRRFFLIYQYEAIGRSESDDYSKIYSMLVSAEQNARAYFMQCGNNIIQPKNPDQAVAEILYMFFNRRSCVDEPFTDRVNRVIIDTMAAKEKVIGVDPIPHISVRQFIAPRGLDLSHYNYIVMDGRYYCFLYIKGNGYPSTVRGGWMSSLINAGEGIDIDVHLSRENRSKTIDKVAQRIRLNRTKLKGMQDTSTDYEELTNSIQAGYYIKNGIANHNEDLFYMSVFVTISAKTYDELLWRKQQMIDMLKSMDMYLSDCRFQQEDALRSIMPFLQISPKLQKKTQRNVLTSGAASTYMFTSFEMSDDSGVLLGVNRHNNSLCIVDLFNTKINKNANLTMCGTSGAGKTFTLQLLALRMRMRGIQCYIIAPIKGHEFKRACSKIGGEFSSLFFSFLFIKLTRFADLSPGGRCPVPVNLILDEFNNIGRIGGAPDGSDFCRSLSVIRSRDIRVMLAVQSLGQLQNRYPNNLWSEIIGNCDIQLMLGCTDDVTADYISDRSGEMCIVVDSTMTVKKTVAVAQVIPQYRETQGQGKRKLLTPDEVLRLPHEQMLVIIRGQNLLRLNKFDYTRHPMSKEMIQTSIMDYCPRIRYTPTPQTGSENEPDKKPRRESRGRKLSRSDTPPVEF